MLAVTKRNVGFANNPVWLLLLSESSQTVIVVTASVKEDERGAPGHKHDAWRNILVFFKVSHTPLILKCK
jgi:hypothetical protein